METPGAPLVILLCIGGLLATAYAYWRYVWFFRNPERRIPVEPGVLSPADGTVVYVERVTPGAPVLSIKKGVVLRIEDILREPEEGPLVLIGIFMSPFNVHYNRSPISGEVVWVRHHGPRLRNLNMGAMHWRTLLRHFPLYEKSGHILENERTVTLIRGDEKRGAHSCHVVQIAGGHVRGIRSFVSEGERVARGQIFGMIRIGSQVDVVTPWEEGMALCVKPGDRVRAGETILLG